MTGRRAYRRDGDGSSGGSHGPDSRNDGIAASFEAALRQGAFEIPVCDACHSAVWPPSDFCSRCLGTVSLRGTDPGLQMRGRIVGVSEDTGRAGGARGADGMMRFFCLVELDQKIRVVAGLSSVTRPDAGSRVVLRSCGLSPNGGGYMFEVGVLPDAANSS